jgi:hypothetical protein
MFGGRRRLERRGARRIASTNSQTTHAPSSPLAQDEAQRFNHSYIGSEYLLLGLLRLEDV